MHEIHFLQKRLQACMIGLQATAKRTFCKKEPRSWDFQAPSFLLFRFRTCVKLGFRHHVRPNLLCCLCAWTGLLSPRATMFRRTGRRHGSGLRDRSKKVKRTRLAAKQEECVRNGQVLACGSPEPVDWLRRPRYMCHASRRHQFVKAIHLPACKKRGESYESEYCQS